MDKRKPQTKREINELRNAPTLLARKTVKSKIPESYQNAMDYLKRKRKAEFSERLGADRSGWPTLLSFKSQKK